MAVDGVATTSFCVDLDTYIGVGSYPIRALLDPYTATTPAGEAPRDFAWAGLVMENFGFDIDALVSATVTRKQAITGIQAAIWEGLYGGGIVLAPSLSDGARSVFDTIMGAQMAATGASVIAEMEGVQDQITTAPIPEPTAGLVFGIGLVIISASRRNGHARR